MCSLRRLRHGKEARPAVTNEGKSVIPCKTGLATNVKWTVMRKLIYRQWSVRVEMSGGGLGETKGCAWSRRSAMRQAEQVLRMYSLMTEMMEPRFDVTE